ncbi:unnamed protein product [Linum trigynum]|uniref:Uncharacterized protein n=1 Tax=Linum trigynum TaxID=586398 RepID=A0AAV2ERS7_9ROSI
MRWICLSEMKLARRLSSGRVNVVPSGLEGLVTRRGWAGEGRRRRRARVKSSSVNSVTVDGDAVAKMDGLERSCAGIRN